MKVRVWNGDRSECLGVGEYNEKVKVYFVHMPDGGLQSLKNAEVEPPPEMVPEGAEVIEMDNPKIVLESGEVVYGCQTWWHPIETETKILEALGEIVDDDAIPEWLDTHNTAFEGRTPRSLLERGDFQPLLEMIHRLGSGEPSS